MEPQQIRKIERKRKRNPQKTDINRNETAMEPQWTGTNKPMRPSTQKRARTALEPQLKNQLEHMEPHWNRIGTIMRLNNNKSHSTWNRTALEPPWNRIRLKQSNH